MKLSKIKIEELVKEIENFLREHELLADVCIYFNNKRHLWHNKYDEKWNFLGFGCDVEEDISPLDYFEYVNVRHILSMSFEGDFYHVMNGYTKREFDLQDKFLTLLNKYGLYYELGNAWNLSCYPTNDDMEIEYTLYEKNPEPEHIWLEKDGVPMELKSIMRTWYELSKDTGDIGSCVIGAGFKFNYKGKPYFMSACSPWQGSISWEKHKEIINELLKNIGATEIYYDYGRMD